MTILAEHDEAHAHARGADEGRDILFGPQTVVLQIVVGRVSPTFNGTNVDK